MKTDEKIREAVLKAGSLVRAMIPLRQAGLPPDVMHVLEVVAEAEAQLAASRGSTRTGKKNRLDDGTLQAIEFLLGEGLSYGEIAKRVTTEHEKVSKSHVGYVALRLKRGKHFTPRGDDSGSHG